jgi:sugar phosphate isomerase/epimerase
VVAAADVAGALGCDYIVTGTGSNSPVGGWHPHPDNFGPEAWKRFLDSVSDAVDQLSRRGVTLALKPHVLTVLDSPARIAQMLSEIDSPYLAAGFDPVNLAQVPDCWGGEDLMNRCLEAGQDRIAYAHVKDYLLRPEMVTTIEEVPVGSGSLNLSYFLDRAAECSVGGWVVVEHLSADQLPAALAALDRANRERPAA